MNKQQPCIIKYPDHYNGEYYICPDCKVKACKINYELVCKKCGLIILQNMSYWAQRTPTLSKNSDMFEINYNNWITCILAKEEISKGLYNVLDQIKSDGPHLSTIQDVRRELKKIKRANYNKNAPLILKRIAGIGPPDIPDEILTQCRMIFIDFIKVQIFLGSGKNNMQYSYSIYKIFDSILPKGDKENRRILNFIHLPGDKTLKKYDKEWERLWWEPTPYFGARGKSPKVLNKPVCQITC